MYVVGTRENFRKNSSFNDKAAGVYNFCFALGTIIAPNIGGVLSDTLGFRYMCDTMAILMLFFGFVFFFINIGCAEFSRWQPDPVLDDLEVKDDSSIATISTQELDFGHQGAIIRRIVIRSEQATSSVASS